MPAPYPARPADARPTLAGPAHLPTDPDDPVAADWLAHVHAGRIGTRTATPAHVAEVRDATAALFRAHRRARRA